MRAFQQVEYFPAPEQLAEVGLPSQPTVEQAMRKLLWGTHGRPTTSDCTWILLCELSSDHLENILAGQRQIPELYSRVILALLKERYQSQEEA